MTALAKISVIIPIFKVEKYIEQCIAGVTTQTYNDLEIILVDDGSPDCCPQICDEWAKRDRRIQVIHKKNGGLSSARNAGVKAATGDYVIFLDGDDYWDDIHAVERLIQRIQTTHTDVLNYSYKKVSEKTGEQIPYFHDIKDMPPENREKSQQLAYLADHGLYIASACNKMIRREILTDEMLFQEGVYSEDVEWCARLMIRAESMDFVCENFYCYRQNDLSISHTINGKKCRDLCDHIVACIRVADTSPGDIRESLYRYSAYQYGTFFMVQARAVEEPRDCMKELAKHRGILRFHGNNVKLLGLFYLTTLLGYRNTCRLIRLVYGMKDGKAKD